MLTRMHGPTCIFWVHLTPFWPKAEHGDCNVPRDWAEDPPLGVWVSKQRTLKKLLDRGAPAPKSAAARLDEGLLSLPLYNLFYVENPYDYKKCQWRITARPRISTQARVARLEALGFGWVTGRRRVGGAALPNEAAWEGRFAQLAAYKAAYGDCNVPQKWAEDQPLGSWVMSQRARKRKLDRGESGEGMTATRVARLDALGFIWEASSHRPRSDPFKDLGSFF